MSEQEPQETQETQEEPQETQEDNRVYFKYHYERTNSDVNLLKPNQLHSDIKDLWTKIDFKSAKMTNLPNGKVIYVYSTLILTTKFGEMLFVMDYENNIHQTNKSTTTQYKEHLSNLSAKEKKQYKTYADKFRNIVISNKSPIMVIEILSDEEYNGNPYKKFSFDFV